MACIGNAGVRGLRAALMGLALAAAGSVGARADDAHPFEQYVGFWQGSGRIESVKGETQAMSCSATCEESEGGKALSQSIECQGPRFKFQIENYIVAKGSEIVGNWRELTQQVIGNVTGRIEGTQFTGQINAPLFTASVWMKADQRSQALRVLPKGVDVAKVEIVMKRQ